MSQPAAGAESVNRYGKNKGISLRIFLTAAGCMLLAALAAWSLRSAWNSFFQPPAWVPGKARKAPMSDESPVPKIAQMPETQDFILVIAEKPWFGTLKAGVYVVNPVTGNYGAWTQWESQVGDFTRPVREWQVLFASAQRAFYFVPVTYSPAEPAQLYSLSGTGEGLRQVLLPKGAPVEHLVPSISADGHILAYQTRVTKTLDTDEDTAVIMQSFKQDAPASAHQLDIAADLLALSPDGNLLVAIRKGRVQVMSSDGSDLRMTQIEIPDARFIAWSPDGLHIAIAAKSSSPSVWIFDRDLQNERPLPLPPSAGYEVDSDSHRREGIHSLAFSPDGKMLALFADLEGSCVGPKQSFSDCDSALYLVQLDGTGLRRLSTRQHGNGNIFWVPARK